METEDSVKEYLAQGLMHHINGDFDQAIAACTNAIQLDPNDANVYFFRGSAYLNKGDYDSAIADFTQAIQLNPNNSMIYCNRGVAYAGKGDFDRTAEDIDTVLRLDPDNAQVKQLIELAQLMRSSSFQQEAGSMDNGYTDK
jgi:tetratricopeptide (TPR) repeat protein